MIITETKQAGQALDLCHLSLDGDMTIYTAEEIHKDISNYLTTPKSLFINLENVEEIDSTGLQILLAVNQHTKEQGHSLILKKPSNAVIDALNLLNLADRFQLE